MSEIDKQFRSFCFSISPILLCNLACFALSSSIYGVVVGACCYFSSRLSILSPSVGCISDSKSVMPFLMRMLYHCSSFLMSLS